MICEDCRKQLKSDTGLLDDGEIEIVYCLDCKILWSVAFDDFEIKI